MARKNIVGRAYHSVGRFVYWSLVAPAIRVSAFFSKELEILFKQRVLVGSLVLGPFLILLAFGLLFRGRQPDLAAIIVVPPDPATQEWARKYAEQPIPGFRVIGQTQDEQAARDAVAAGRADVAVVIPRGIQQQVESGNHATLVILHNIVDPTQRQWLTFNTYILINELNKRVLADTLKSVRPLPIPADVAAAPFQAHEVSLALASPSYVAFYTPGVLALLLQHLAVTLGALSLVRERLLRAVELFRVAPLSTLEILVGKSLAYGLVLLLVAAVLTVVGHLWLGVPFLGPLKWLGVTQALLVVASLGVGFAISVLSRTEQQAVQLAMLVLLASVFFSGFFVPLSTFYPAATVLADLLPVTHGVAALQDLLLRDQLPSLPPLVALLITAFVTFLFSTIRFHRQLRLD